jgi:ParB family chromosome partitioning protein
LPDQKQQMQICQRIIQKGLSVRQAEQITGGFRSRKRSAKRNETAAEIRAIEEKLQHALGTKVRIQHGTKRGKIEIEYYSLDDLERVLKVLRVQ